MPGRSRERWARVRSQTRFISGGALNRVGLALVGYFVSFLNNDVVCDPIYGIVILFDSVPTRFCLGTWQMLLSSPILVMWKSNC